MTCWARTWFLCRDAGGVSAIHTHTHTHTHKHSHTHTHTHLSIHKVTGVDHSAGVDKVSESSLCLEVTAGTDPVLGEEVVVDGLPQLAQPEALLIASLCVDCVWSPRRVHFYGILVA